MSQVDSAPGQACDDASEDAAQANTADEADTLAKSSALGSAFATRGFGFLSTAAATAAAAAERAGSAAAAASSAAAKAAAEAASSAAAKDAIGSLGGLTSSLTSALKTDSDEEDREDEPVQLDPAKFYSVVLQKAEGAKLGLRLERRDNSTLFVNSVTGGLASEWNEKQSDLQVHAGDRIVEANGVKGDANQLMDEVKKTGELWLTLCRGAPVAGSASVPPAGAVPALTGGPVGEENAGRTILEAVDASPDAVERAQQESSVNALQESALLDADQSRSAEADSGAEMATSILPTAVIQPTGAAEVGTIALDAVSGKQAKLEKPCMSSQPFACAEEVQLAQTDSAASDPDVKRENTRLKSRVSELEDQAASQKSEADAQLLSALSQITRLQGRIHEVEQDNEQKEGELQTLRGRLQRSDREAQEHQTAAQKVLTEKDNALKSAQAFEKELQRQVEELNREVDSVKNRARADADKEKEATIDEMRGEIEKELESMMRSKDKQVSSLRAELRQFEAERDDLAKQLERRLAEVDALRAELDATKQEGRGQLGDHKRELDQIAAEHQQRVEELEQRKDVEERHKQELATSLRSVEERARLEMSQLETQKSALELQLAALQSHHEAKLQECADLSAALGEALASAAAASAQAPQPPPDVAGSGAHDESARLAAEVKIRQLEDHLQASESKLLEAQANRDMFTKECDMYRAELKIARDERSRSDKELSAAQARIRDLQAAQSQAEGSSATQTAAKDGQKDFEERMARHREEVHYLRQKCDEKEKRCEQLLAERSSLKIELRNARATGGAIPPPAALSEHRDMEAGAPTTAKATGKTSAGRSLVRSFPLSAPSWLRSFDTPLQVVIQTLARHPEARLIVFLYAVMLHIWVLIVFRMDEPAPKEADFVAPQGSLLAGVSEAGGEQLGGPTADQGTPADATSQLSSS